jgi:hypothetical protein
MHPEIVRTIEILNQRIEKLKVIRAGLIEEYGDPTVDSALPKAIDEAGRSLVNFPASPTVERAPELGRVKPGAKVTQKARLAQYFQEHGPQFRKMIASGSGIAQGTLGWLLQQKEFFHQLPDGRWDVIRSDAATEALDNHSPHVPLSLKL